MSVVSLIGTLIAVAPTRDGVVMAADSRSTLGGQYCDGTYKLVEVAHPNPTAIAVAGIGIVFSKPPAGTVDLCEWVKSAPRVMDIERFAKEYIESHPNDISREGILRLGTASLEEVRKLQTISPDAPDAYAGNNLYTIVISTYDAEAKQARIGAVGVRFNPASRTPELTDSANWSFSQNSRGQAFHFGLFEYVAAHVFREGRHFLKEYPNFNPNERFVRDIGVDEATAALLNLIDAAAKTTQIVPVLGGVGIGGPVDVLLLGDDPQTKRIRWKSN